MCRYRQPGMLAALTQDSAEAPADPPPDRHPETDDALTANAEERMAMS